MAAPILTTKLYIPPIRPELVPRSRLVERLNAGLREACKLTLISAPAGFGKTTLLNEWIHQRDEGGKMKDEATVLLPPFKVAWLSLDEDDNDPTRFLAYLIAAVQTVEKGIGTSVLDALQSPHPPAIQELVAALINEINTDPSVLVLVLDDYHLISAQPIHDTVAFLLDHLPGNLHLVIASRSDPPLPLARLRARGQLIEMRQADLRFTSDQAAEFLRQVAKIELAVDDVAALTSHTEGWIAGLQMAALALQGTLALQAHSSQASDAAARFVRAFTGSHRYILDYLVEEIFQRQPESVQTFLLYTSILDQLAGPLCNAVANRDDGQATLEQLDRANLFIVALDDERRWYRYHRLFADLLRKRLYQAYPKLVPTLHRRASEWHERNGYMAEAIEHALSADDFDRAAQLLEQVAQATLMRSEIVTFMNWVDKLPEELVRARPDLSVFHGWALLISGHPLDVVESRLKNIDTSSSLMAAKVCVLRACIAGFQGQMSVAAQLAHQALKQLPEDDLFMRINAAWMLSNTYVAAGDFLAASQAFGELARTSLQAGHVMIAVGALCHLAEVHLRLAQTHEAKAAYEKAIDVATDAQGQRLPIAGEALMGLGDLCRELNELEAALHYTLDGIELSRLWRSVNAALGYITLARTKQMQGNVKDVDEAMEAARQLAVQYDTSGLGVIGVGFYQALLWIEQGNLDAALRWAKERRLDGEIDPAELDRKDDYASYHLRKYEYLVLARLWLAQNCPDKALSVLEPVLIRMEQQGRTRLLLETLMLQALAFRAQNKLDQALAALGKALALAEPGGYIRLFADEGPPMARLLRETAAHGLAPKYIAKLLAAFAKTPKEQRAPETVPSPSVSAQPSLVEPLSERELQVLQLLAAGLSNPEIAQQLYVAVSTVRSHAKSIYGKLDVHGRWEAVQRAKELRLL